MKLYNTIKINNHSYYINDEDGDSCYLIIGNTHALLIDLGLFKEPLLPTIKNITNKELIIVCTHGHFDHIGIIKEFKEEYPQIKYQFYSGNADDIKERLDKGLIDIGLLTEPVDIEKYEFVRLEQKEVWGILAPKDSKLAAKEYATPQDLLKLPLLSTRRTIVQNEIANWFGQDYEQLDIIATYNLIYNAAIMVEEGIGYAICLEKLVNINDETKIRFIPFYPPLLTGTVIVWKKHQIFSPATARFIEKIKHSLKA